MQVTLRKALQIKNRLAGEIGQLNRLIQQNNSVQDGKDHQFNVGELLSKRAKKVATLIQLKTDITVANVKIYNMLAQMEEYKAEIQFLRSLNTISGEQDIGYDGTRRAIFTAYIKAAEVEDKVTELSKNIEELQDKVDHYNSTTVIEYNE